MPNLFMKNKQVQAMKPTLKNMIIDKESSRVVAENLGYFDRR